VKDDRLVKILEQRIARLEILHCTPESTAQCEALWDYDNLARFLGLDPHRSRRTLGDLVNAAGLPSLRLGHRTVRFVPVDVLDWLRRNPNALEKIASRRCRTRGIASVPPSKAADAQADALAGKAERHTVSGTDIPSK
jgi:hypothetical protein